MTAFAGIDYDTNAVHIVGIYEGDQRPYYFRFDLEGVDAFERARDVRTKMPSRSWWENHGFVGCAIEEQASGNPKMRASVQKLKMIQGAVLSCIPRDLVVEPVLANQWREKIGIPGRATKDEVEFWCRFSSPHALSGFFSGLSWPQDAFDAYCLALVAEKLTVPA